MTYSLNRFCDTVWIRSLKVICYVPNVSVHTYVFRSSARGFERESFIAEHHLQKCTRPKRQWEKLNNINSNKQKDYTIEMKAHCLSFFFFFAHILQCSLRG